MGIAKIIAIIGESASGKDTIFKQLKDRGYPCIITCTTRPKREGEMDGVDYHFLSEGEFDAKIDGLFGVRHFNVYGESRPEVWRYGILKSDLDNADPGSLIILDPTGVEQLREEYGETNVRSIYIYADESTRRKRAETRSNFNLEEWERRERNDAPLFEIGLERCSGITTNLTNSIDQVVSQIERQIQELVSMGGGV